MKKIRLLILVIALTGSVIGVGASCGSSGSGGIAAFTFTSSDIASGGAIAQLFAWTFCGGSNTSPQLSWSNVPEGTLSFAILLLDRDANTFIHWILYNIPGATTSIAQGDDVPTGVSSTANGFTLLPGYGGPCPSIGDTHTYQFQIYALDVADATTIAGFDASTNEAFTASIAGNVLDSTGFSATYTGL